MSFQNNMEEQKEKTWKLYELLSDVKLRLSGAYPSELWVEGEVSSITNGGDMEAHCFIDLVEMDQSGNTIAHVKATIWRSLNFRLIHKFYQATGRAPAVGDLLKVKVFLSFSERYGISLNIKDIDVTFTLGLLLTKKKETWERLVKEGLTERNKELEIPLLPFNIAVISANGAAGYGDFMNHISQGEEELGCKFRITLFEAPMQGDSAPDGIESAFSQINSSPKHFDVVVLIRGGGSELDLACFDDYKVAKAIALSNYPVISGIGHERDNHICDDVASIRVKTPTAAADFIVETIAEQIENIEFIETALYGSIEKKIATQELHLVRIISKIKGAYSDKILFSRMNLEKLMSQFRKSFDDKIANSSFQLEKFKIALWAEVERKILNHRNSLLLLEQKIGGANPSNILNKGYALLDADGRKLTKVHLLNEGSRVRIQMMDGVAEFTIKDLKFK